MGSIFFRIYTGMLIAMLVIALAIYAVLQLVNSYRADEYRHEMAEGLMWLVANGSLRYQPAFRKKWLDFNSGMLNMPFSIEACDKLVLKPEEKEKLNNGELVIFLPNKSEVADAYYRLPSEKEKNCLQTKITNVFSEEVARAIVVLVLDELGQSDRSEWDKAMISIQSHFAYPIKRVTFEQVSLEDKQLKRLQRREVVTEIGDGTQRDSTDIWVYSAIGSTGEVLKIGPIKLFNWLPIHFAVIAGIIGLALMALMVYFLVRPLQRRLNKMEKAVIEVGKGNLSVRVDASGKNAIGQLANAFNGMTEHISRLIHSQQEMIRAVSHELRTPVARIRFGLEMLVDQESQQQREQQVNALDEDIDQLDSLIDEVLTYARLEQGSPKIEFEKVNVAEIIEDIVKELKPIASQCEFIIDNDYEQQYKKALISEVHPLYWKRAIQNLISNAVKYGKEKVRIQIIYNDLTKMAAVRVEDNGVGIPKESREKVFEPFSRLDNSRTRETGGYGLGLSIVRRIADWHGGSVRVEKASKLQGACFIFEWPLKNQSQHVLS